MLSIGKNGSKWQHFLFIIPNRIKSDLKGKLNTRSFVTAKKHLRAWVKHKTGGGPPPPALTDIDQVMLRMFGNTAAFRGE